jgi:hypothetical protein
MQRWGSPGIKSRAHHQPAEVARSPLEQTSDAKGPEFSASLSKSNPAVRHYGEGQTIRSADELIGRKKCRNI